MRSDWRSAHAEGWARTVVAAVRQTYPWAAQHTVTGPRYSPAMQASIDTEG